jgi:cytochrome c
MLRERPQLFAALVVSCLALVMAGWAPRLTGQPAPVNGKELFGKRCGGCHAIDRDKEGPRLGGVYGRQAGSVSSFQYSDALKNVKFIWNEQLLEKWLTDPEQLVPDNDMAFRLEDGGERHKIITYLKEQSSKP